MKFQQQLLHQTVIIICIFTHIISLGEDARGFLDFWFSPCKCKCGLPNRQARLLGGEYLRGYEFPWLALLQIDGQQHAVPGTLINNKYIISAAAPLVNYTPYDVKATLGQFDRCVADVSSTNVSVDKIAIHPDFSPANRAHDLALVRLSAPVIIERRISPICLSVPGHTYLGQVATMVGWAEGAPVDGPVAASCRPRKVGMPILGHQECLGTALNAQYVSTDTGCVGVIGSPSPICMIDAGGPVMFRTHGAIYELIGILTDKNECGTKPSTALYTNINDHLLWITQNTRDACYCFKT